MSPQARACRSPGVCRGSEPARRRLRRDHNHRPARSAKHHWPRRPTVDHALRNETGIYSLIALFAEAAARQNAHVVMSATADARGLVPASWVMRARCVSVPLRRASGVRGPAAVMVAGLRAVRGAGDPGSWPGASEGPSPPPGDWRVALTGYRAPRLPLRSRGSLRGPPTPPLPPGRDPPDAVRRVTAGRDIPASNRRTPVAARRKNRGDAVGHRSVKRGSAGTLPGVRRRARSGVAFERARPQPVGDPPKNSPRAGESMVRVGRIYVTALAVSTYVCSLSSGPGSSGQ